MSTFFHIKQEQSPIRREGKFVETTGENALVKLAVQELEQFFFKQIQKIKTLLEGGVVVDNLWDRRANNVGAGRRQTEWNNLKEFEHLPQGYRRQGQHNDLQQQFCRAYRSNTSQGIVLNQFLANTRQAASDDVLDKNFSSENDQKSSKQSGATQSSDITSPISDSIIEEKLKRIDKLTPTETHPKKAQWRKTNLHRKKLSFGTVSRKNPDWYAYKRTIAKQLREYKQQLFSRKKANLQGQVEEADQKQGSEFFESPRILPETGQSHWSDELPEHSYSQESVTLIREFCDRKSFKGVYARSPRGLWTGSCSSSESVRDIDDFLLNNPSNLPQLPGTGTQRGRLALRRFVREHASSWRSPVQSALLSQEKEGRVQQISSGYGSLKESKRIQKASINPRSNDGISNSEENVSVHIESNSVIDIQPETYEHLNRIHI